MNIQRSGTRWFWYGIILGPLLATAGLLSSHTILSRWADRIGGLGFTMNPKYRDVVTSQGLTWPFLLVVICGVAFYSFIATQLYKEKRMGYFWGVLIYAVVIGAAFSFGMMILSIAALD